MFEWQKQYMGLCGGKCMHAVTKIEQKCTYLRVLLTGFGHDCSYGQPDSPKKV
jgi:hypothetical protein